jgi:hypothetical protein
MTDLTGDEVVELHDPRKTGLKIVENHRNVMNTVVGTVTTTSVTASKRASS